MRQHRIARAEIGAHLLAARQEAGLSQKDAADELGVDQSQVSQWEHDVYNPRVRHLLALVEVYGVSPNRLLGYPSAQPSPTDPAELGAWLRALPENTILLGHIGGSAWQLGAGVEPGVGDDREFPALIAALGSDPFEITDGHSHLAVLTEFAPFTVLHLGDLDYMATGPEFPFADVIAEMRDADDDE